MSILDENITQAGFAHLVGISQQTVSALIARSILTDGETTGQWLQAYCSHLREIAAGRVAEGGIELATERALLARAQREKVEMQNAVARSELAPRSLLIEVLAMTVPKVCGVLDAIVPALRSTS